MDRPRKSGGWKFHKQGCTCPVCTSQRRQAEALAAGVGRNPIVVPSKANPKDVINADLPAVFAEGRTGRDRIMQFLAIRGAEPELTHADIARKLGIAPRTLYNLITKATNEGWLKFSDPISRMEHEIIPKVMDNLNHFLDLKDRTVTIEAAKGTIFRKYQEEQGISDAAQTVLALRIEVPDSAGAPRVVTGRIVGKAKQIESE